MNDRTRIAVWLTALCVCAAGARALVYVPVLDGSLVDRAAVVAQGRIVSRSVGSEAGRVVTSYEFEVRRAFKGPGTGSRLTVAVPGGIDLQNGLGTKIFGTPRFRAGDSALLFLAASGDGTHRVLHLFQGAFLERRNGERRAYWRPGPDRVAVADSDEIDGEPPFSAQFGVPEAADNLRDAELFERWVADRLRGIEREADYFVPAEATDALALAAPFTYLAGEEFILRWFEFDGGGKVRWYRHKDGQSGLPGGGAKEFKKARRAWKKKFSGVPIRLKNAGSTSSTTGFARVDSRNTLLHSDFNDEIGEDFDCEEGGTLAIGGLQDFDFFFTTWKGLSTLAVHEAEIIMNDGIECFVDGDSDVIAQIYAHELGHTLGLGHSCGDSTSPKCSKSEFLEGALMAARLEEVFGARIQDDDILAARQLYDEDFWAAACEKKVPGAKGFCRKCGPCGEGQGNCRKDGDCFGDLVCTRDVGEDFGFDADVNVCTAP